MNPADLGNRLRKNARHWGKWARREGLEAYRLYDRDIPEFPYAIDRYGDYVQVQEFERDQPWAAAQRSAHLAAMAEALQLPADHLVFKQRRRQRGSAQYEKTATPGHRFPVRERELRFEVNLGRYLDTGLFLDHRDTRRLVGAAAAGRTCLNLFAYTGSFTVYLAAGGAQRTVTVDMSHTYQAWTRRNLLLNGIDDFKRHRLVGEDVLQFLQQAVAARARFDLIVLDPPSFSNSKRMQDTFDVQRDHPQLLRQTLRLLAPDGLLYFSTNRRGFRLDAGICEAAHTEEITRLTVPPDFRRHLPHRCWLLRPA
ncbi:MAG: ribosomal large subunit methyltransferase [Pseudomonadota bacterium]